MLSTGILSLLEDLLNTAVIRAEYCCTLICGRLWQVVGWFDDRHNTDVMIP